jgi:mRNA interferase RelE/StbE
MFEGILSPTAAEFYAAADRPLALKLARCFRRLEADPRHGSNIKRLTKGIGQATFAIGLGIGV